MCRKMGFDYYNFDTDAPDVDPERMKEDFEVIFNRNAIDVELIKVRKDLDDVEGGDLFETRSPTRQFRKIIRLFINASSSDAYRRSKEGIVTNDAVFHAFSESDVEIDNDDMIKFFRTTKILNIDIKRFELFIVQNHNRPNYKGQFTWQEFDLKRSDKEQR